MGVDNFPPCGNIGDMLKRYPILIFAIYLSFYAISPLSYTYERKQVYSQTGTNLGNFKLLIIELLLSRLTQQGEEDGSPSNRFLFKKKRATISSDKLKVSKGPARDIGVISDRIILPETPSIAIVAQDNRSRYKRHSHLLLHSGLSPPSV